MNFSSYFKKLLKYSAIEIFSNSLRINKRINKIHNMEYLTILNLHRVSTDDGSSYTPLDPEIFTKLIIFLKKNYHIISFKDIEEKKIKEFSFFKRPKVILSFDDGYKDFIEIAHPILMKYGIRANHNIVPICVEKERPPFNVVLQDYIGKNSREKYFNLKIPNYKWNKSLNKIEEGIKLSSFLKNKTITEQEKYESICYEQIGEKLYADATKMMSIKDIIYLKDYHDLGAHSFRHSSMANETEEYFIKDLKLCTKWFEDNLDMNPYIYAFPNGSYKNSHLRIARENGYSQLLLVDQKFSKIRNNIHTRFNFHASTEKEMIFKATGSSAKL